VHRESRRFGFRSHYPVAPWSDCMEIHWSTGCQFYITPVASDEVCVVLMSRDPYLRIVDALPRFPALCARLHGVQSSSPERGALAGTYRLKRVTRGHIALAGDASGTVDAITGEGICLAFQQSLAISSALESGGLRRYQAEHTRLARRPVLMAGFMLNMDRSNWLRDQAVSALAARPEIFAGLLAAHVGQRNLAQFAVTAASLGWVIATT